MTVTQRKRQHQPDEIQTVTEPGVQIECDACACDLTHSVRMKCADPVCEPGDGVDICPACFCAGKEFLEHKRWHAYRVVELHSYPIFSEDWGADEELLLLEGLGMQGMGNWQAIAEHVGTRTKEEVEKHYNEAYVDSPTWPLPRMDLHFEIDPAEFHARKRRRIAKMDSAAPVLPKVAPTSAPAVHEIAGFLPGRLEFEHELDNEAEDLVKDLEFGACLILGGDAIPEDDADPDVRARAKWVQERRAGQIRFTGASSAGGGGTPVPGSTGVGVGPVLVREVAGKRGKKLPNGHGPGPNGNANGHSRRERAARSEDDATADGEDDGEEAVEEEQTQPPPIESAESLAFKLTLLEMYQQRVQKRAENKQLMFNRGLLDYKKMQAADKKRSKEEKDVITRLRPFAKLQTAEDFEEFVTDTLYESVLRRRIQELQIYRRLGLRTAADIEKYEADVTKRSQAKATFGRDLSSDRLGVRGVSGRGSSGPEARRGSFASLEPEGRGSRERDLVPVVPLPPVRKGPAPLNLANSPSLHLLTPAEQTLCSQLRILPKPYLVIKETLVREYARRGGKLRRREARDLVKIDVNKTSRVWDFLVQAGYLRVNSDAVGTSAAAENGNSAGLVAPGAISMSPSKDSAASRSPRPPTQPAIALNGIPASWPPPTTAYRPAP